MGENRPKKNRLIISDETNRFHYERTMNYGLRTTDALHLVRQQKIAFQNIGRVRFLNGHTYTHSKERESRRKEGQDNRRDNSPLSMTSTIDVVPDL